MNGSTELTANSANSNATPHLDRGLSEASATALNMIDMIGVGPFITIPLIIGAMGGPQAMLGWILGAVFALCDGMIWAELGAAMPGSGGSYRYLREIYGAQKLGRLLSFLFIWQLSFSAPLSIASGCIGLSHYASYLWPGLQRTYFARDLSLHVPFLGPLQASVAVRAETFLAILTVIIAVWLLYRRITIVGVISKLLWAGVLGTIAWIIFSGISNFDVHRAFDFPTGAFTLSPQFFTGLGMAMLVATYDYWGYYNVCFLGEEVRNPVRTIPRALIKSIVAVAAIYIVMNISILGVLPWRELAASGQSEARFYVISLFMDRVHGHTAAVVVTVLIMWTAFASVFSLLLGYSRVPYAAAVDGNYFRAFSRVHKQHHIPHVSLLALGAVAVLCCFLRLADVIAALVVIRIMLQFLVQAIGLIYLRWSRPDFPRPFRMWLYPLPALAAIVGFVYVLVARKGFLKEVRYAAVLAVVGLAVFMWRAWRTGEWPFVKTSAPGSAAQGL
jgi:amino acid transporter